VHLNYVGNKEMDEYSNHFCDPWVLERVYCDCTEFGSECKMCCRNHRKWILIGTMSVHVRPSLKVGGSGSPEFSNYGHTNGTLGCLV
jgi:hypothetical protein